MRTDDLDFHLPPELIAQSPAQRRPDARLLVAPLDGGDLLHRHIRDLPSLLKPGDVLLLNNTAVLPARFTLRKPTGGLVEGLFIAGGTHRWQAMLKNLGPIKPEMSLTIEGDDSATFRVIEKLSDGTYALDASASGQSPAQVLARAGRMPLPPYIRRQKLSDDRDAADRERYQTVFAGGEAQSVAAPTAGLHFDDVLLAELRQKQVVIATVTLHVGLGTFKLVERDEVEQHPMHAERWELSADAAEAINIARQRGGRVIAVGTTAARTLESQPPGKLSAGSGETSLLITPPYEWKHVQGLMTNFHLPRSTLIAMIAGFTGLERQRQIYAQAIAHQYRFFSYGDAMLML